MESAFYKYGHKKRLPVTHLLLELFSKSVENSGPDAPAKAVLEPVLSALGLKPPFKEEDLLSILTDIKEIQEKKSSRSSDKPKSNSRDRKFGDEFMKWFLELGIEKSLYLLSDFDYEKASHLYCNVPVEVIDVMLETKFGYEWTLAEAGFESVVLGMGGKIRSKSSIPDASFDVPKTEQELKERNNKLKALGF